ncbi:MAG: hypothetical protein ACQEQ4_01135 [Fibrobacterota bacterium]
MRLFCCSAGIFVLLVSCASRTYIESFYRDENTHQYFVRPSRLDSPHMDVSIDFTYIAADTGSTTCNFTLIPDQRLSAPVSRVFFVMEGDTLDLTQLSPLYRRHSDKTYRYTSQLSNAAFEKLVFSDVSVLHILLEDEAVFKAEPKTSFLRAMEFARQDIFFYSE